MDLRGHVTIWQFLWDVKPGAILCPWPSACTALVGSRSGLQGRCFLKHTRPGPGKFEIFFELDNHRRGGSFEPAGYSTDSVLRMQQQASELWEQPDSKVRAGCAVLR